MFRSSLTTLQNLDQLQQAGGSFGKSTSVCRTLRVCYPEGSLCVLYIEVHADIYIHMYIHTNIRTYIATAIRAYIHTYVHTYIHMHIYHIYLHLSCFNCLYTLAGRQQSHHCHDLRTRIVGSGVHVRQNILSGRLERLVHLKAAASSTVVFLFTVHATQASS